MTSHLLGGTSPFAICLFTETYHPVTGGGETQARLLAEKLVANGCGVTVITRRSDPALKSIETYGRITVYRVPPVGRGQLKKWGLILTSVPRLIRLRHQYDVIFVSGFRIIGLTAVLLGMATRKRVVLKADSQGEMSGEFFAAGLARFQLTDASLPFRMFLKFRNAVLRRASAFAAITEGVASELDCAGVNPETVHRIPNAVDTELFSAVSSEKKTALRLALELPVDGMILIYTGRLVSYKGLPLLLEVFQELRKRHDRLYLVLVGTGGLDIHNCEEALRTFVIQNGLETSVRFTGSVTNVFDYLQAADIFALPTENDAFPSSLVEAMSCQLPVVTTPVGAIPEIICHGQNGLLVPPGDPSGLYAALDRLLYDRGLAAELGASAAETAQERYSADIVSDRYVQLFSSLATRPQRPA